VSESALLKILQAGKLGEGETLERLFSLFYQELRRMAQWELLKGAPVTLGPTTLLHETFLNVSQRESLTFTNQTQFMAYAARAMRGLIIDHFRNRRSQKRGGHLEIISLPTELPTSVEDLEAIDIESLSQALEALASIDARLADCVDLKFFCGLSLKEMAELRGVSERTVQRDWDKARLLLSDLMRENDSPSA
jgi:RNA polymerase sigma factor (TIGR02999 family)